MPYLLIVIFTIPILSFHTHSFVAEPNYDHLAQSDIRWGATLGGQLPQMEIAIKQRKYDNEVKTWSCTLVLTVCSDAYVRNTTDDGYTDSANWESDLIPTYIPFVDLPSGWFMDVQNTAGAMYVCTYAPGSPEVLRIIRNIVEPGVYLSDGCPSDNVISVQDASALGGSNIYVVKRFEK